MKHKNILKFEFNRILTKSRNNILEMHLNKTFASDKKAIYSTLWPRMVYAQMNHPLSDPHS